MNVSLRLPVMLAWIIATSLTGGELCGDETLTQAIDRLVAKQGFTDDGPGVAILVFQPGKVNFRKGYGLANLKAELPITPRTLFEIASVSKTFTATAILMLHDRGRLSLDDDIRKHLPEMPEYRGGPIRIRDLLHHISGLPDYMDFDDVPTRHGTYWDNLDYLGEFARKRSEHPLDFPTGRKYEYNNTNFMLLGTIVARVGKRSYGTFLREEIFAPAGMQHSFVYESPTSVPASPPVHAVGYESTKKNGWNAAWGSPPARSETDLTVGDGGVWTNLEDMAAWDAALRAEKFVRPATMQQALRPSHTQDGETNDYGLGWEIFFDEGKLIGYGHNGSWGGFRTSYYRYLTRDRTTVILSNRGSFDADAFWYKLDAVVQHHLDSQ